MFLVGGDDKACDGWLAKLNKKFPTNDLGELKRYTGVSFDRNMELEDAADGIHRHYCRGFQCNHGF